MTNSKVLIFTCLIFAATLSTMCSAQGSVSRLKCPSFRLGVSHFACSKLQHESVCVQYKNGTAKTFINSCFGCAADRAKINYFTHGACKANSSSGTVTPARSVPPMFECPKIIGVSHFACSNLDNSPVCGVFSNGTSKTYENSCFACANNISYFNNFSCPASASNSSSTSSSSGSSPSQVSPFHTDPLRLLCPPVASTFACSSQINSPVCGVFSNGTSQTYQNPCFACANNISYYNNFSCPASSNSSANSSSDSRPHTVPPMFLCASNTGANNSACSSEVTSPVCAVLSNGTSKTYQNSCFACDDEISYYNNFACAASTSQQKHCAKVIGFNLIACNGLGNDPVCVMYNNGTVQTFNNSCFACSGDNPDINYYSEGACY